MAWPQKGLTAKEILGMEPTELQAKLDSSASKADLEKLNTAVETQNQSLAAIQASLAKLTAAPPTDPDPNIQLDQNDPTTQVLTDPAGFIRRQTDPIAQTAIQTQADLNEMRARQKYPQHFNQFGEELVSKAGNFSASQRAQPGFWDFHIRTILGEKVLSGSIDAGTYPSLVGSSSFAPHTGEVKDRNLGLDPEMASWLTGRGIPLESAAKLRKMQLDGTEISLENYKGVKVGHA